MGPGFANDDLLTFLRKSFAAVYSDPSKAESSQLSSLIYPNASYCDNEKVEISQWLITSSHLAEQGEDIAKYTERLGSLNIHLSTRTTLLGAKPSVADLALYYRLAPTVKNWSAEERTGVKGYRNIVRHIDFVQNSAIMGLSLTAEEKVSIDPNDIQFIPKPIDAKEEKERKKKEKAAAAAVETKADAASSESKMPIGRAKTRDQTSGGDAAGDKKKKEKPPKQQKSTPASAPLSPRLIDLRVGHILKAIPHPDADSLYVSTIACGDAAGAENTSEYDGKVVRTVCSGLNGLIPLEEMQDRKIIAVCNLKPVTMRGIKSAAMVLAASPRLKEGEADDHKGPVELVDPPAGSAAGERVTFEGWTGEPEGQLNPKKKVFESLQPGFITTENRAVGFDPSSVEALKGDGNTLGLLKTSSGGFCTVKNLTGATVR